MGLSCFPSASEGLVPLLVVNAVLFVSVMKSTLRYVLQLMGSPGQGQGQGQGGGRNGLSVSRFESLSGRSSKNGRRAAECCAVCLSRFEAEEEVGELRCKHLFHSGCLQKWLDNQQPRTCPLCRSII